MFRPAFLALTVALASTQAAYAGDYGEPVEGESMQTEATMAAVPESEPEPARIMRTYAGFLTDAETLRGFWVGMDTDYEREEDFGEFDRWTLNTRLAYGGEMWEAGVQIPYTWLSGGSYNQDYFEDMHFWGKFIPIRTSIFQGGGGLVVYAPTGDGKSADEWGFNPFLTGAFAAGPVSIRGMIGYERLTYSSDSDGVTYNIAVLAPCGERVVLRGEFDGTHYVDYESYENPVNFVPGVDVAFPLGIGELLLRLSGSVGLKNETNDWGVSFGVAYAQI